MDGERVWSHLQTIVGLWDGVGAGRFPTIDDFTYRETVEIEGGSANRRLRFNQSSVRSTEHGMKESHSEAGFLGVADDGTVEMSVAETLDRMEFLRGPMVETSDGWRIELETTSVVNDERVLKSWRVYDLVGSQVKFTMGMATGAVPDGEVHLDGVLKRRN